MTGARSGVDILVIGAHPDDAEIACGGTVLRVTRGGGAVAVLDLSAGERATRGSASIRREEAKRASDVLGLAARDNLGLPDCAIRDTEAARLQLVEAIRRHRPDILIAPHPEDHHPDHAAAGCLAAAAAFLSGVGGVGAGSKRHRVRALFFYMMHHRFKPDVIVDVSDVYEDKVQSVQCYASQLHDPNIRSKETLIASKDFLDRLRARNRYYGELIGVPYGEALASRHPPGVHDIRSLVNQ